jgi:hypothetical protein
MGLFSFRRLREQEAAAAAATNIDTATSERTSSLPQSNDLPKAAPPRPTRTRKSKTNLAGN